MPEFSKQTIISLENPKYVRDNFDLTKSLSNFALNQSHFEQLQNYSKYSERFEKTWRKMKENSEIWGKISNLNGNAFPSISK